MKNKALAFSGILFSIMALIHLIRLFSPFQIEIGSFVFPIWFSIFFFVVAGLLAAWMFRAMCEKGSND